MGSIFGGKSPSIPAPPDPLAIGRQQAQFNRVNQSTPFGELKFSGPDRNNARIVLTPAQQRAVNLAVESAGVVPDALSSEQVAGDIFQSFQNRIAPEFGRRRDALQERLVQQGIPATGADLANAAVSELDVLGNQENDAMIQAFLQSQGIGAQQRLADIQGSNAIQGQLNQNAQLFGGGPLLGQQPAPLDLLGAYRLQQNQQLANAQLERQSQGSKNNLFGRLGSAAIGFGLGGPAGAAATTSLTGM